MEFLLKVFGLKDPLQLLMNVATHASGVLTKPLYLNLFKDRMNAESRITLAGKLEKMAGHLRKGECAKAAEVAADITDDVRFD